MKKIATVITVMAVICALGFRILAVNQQIQYPPIVNYKMNEEVPVGNNIFLDEYENMEGYSVTVKNAQIMTYHEYLQKYNYVEEESGQLYQEDESVYPEMICELEILIKNHNSDENVGKGIDFINYKLTGDDFVLHISDLLYDLANPTLEKGQRAFRLRANSEKVFYLPFYFSPSSSSTPIQIDDVRESNLYLPISLYPEQRQIVVEEN